jgi:capsid protein
VPFRLQAKVKFKNGKLDTSANRLIEDEWGAWGRKGACELSGRFSWNAVQRLLVRTLAVDGELLLRRYRGAEYGRTATACR